MPKYVIFSHFDASAASSDKIKSHEINHKMKTKRGEEVNSHKYHKRIEPEIIKHAIESLFLHNKIQVSYYSFPTFPTIATKAINEYKENLGKKRTIKYSNPSQNLKQS